MAHQTVIVVDFGGQYNQLIARRVRENHVYCEVVPYAKAMQAVQAKKPVGIIFTGGPASVFEEGAPGIDAEIFTLGIPVLGICYGAQLMAQALGGKVVPAQLREYGKTLVNFENKKDGLLHGIAHRGTVWMSHGVMIEEVPPGFAVTAHTPACPVAVMENPEKGFYGLQFHPEVTHTENGSWMIRRFLYDVCGCTGDWTMEDYAETAVRETRQQIGDGRVLLALSGGVDSSVVAALLAKAVGSRLTCIFVDHGLMRQGEGDEIERIFGNRDINFVRVDAQQRFLSRLAGVADPEKKRKIIGEEFIRVFEEEGKKLGRIEFLAQGTIYPDLIESGTGQAHVIKSHHNVGGLPEDVDFKEIVEPLRLLFKDEVRALGRQLGLPESLVSRQPFPGPGLAVRIIGEVSAQKLEILRAADAVFREEIANAGEDKSIHQYFAVLTNMRSVGVMGDGRTYDYTLALRAVTTSDFMTADWARIPYDLLDAISRRIVNEIPHINRIVYDVTSKPPATIEWE